MKKKREEHNLIVLEGGRQVMDAINAKIIPKQIFFTPTAIETPFGQKISQTLHQHENCVQLISEKVFDSISETKNGQGIIATFQKPTLLSNIPTNIQKSPSTPLLFVLLDRLADPGNVGTILRSCYGLGVDLVLSVQSCDIYSSKVLRSAMGVCLNLPIIECDWTDVSRYLGDYQRHLSGVNDGNMLNNISCNESSGETENIACNTLIPPAFQIILADGSDDNTHYDSINYINKHTILVIGSEAHGISQEATTLMQTITDTDTSTNTDTTSTTEIAEIFTNGTHKNAMNITTEMPQIAPTITESSLIKVKIPMSRSLESFNAAVAGSIILAEIHRQKRS